MIILRTFTDYNSHKLIGVTVVDKQTGEWKDIDVNELELRMRNRVFRESIDNAELNSKNEFKFVNINPRHRKNYYKLSYKGNMEIRYYADVSINKDNKMMIYAMTENNGLLSFKTDSLTDLSSAIEISVEELRFINAEMKITEDDEYKHMVTLSIYDVNSGEYMDNIVKTKSATSMKKIISDDWDVDIAEVGVFGAYALEIWNKKELKCGTTPSGIAHIERYTGNLKNLILDNQVRSLSEGAFICNRHIERIKIGKGMEMIPNRCFKSSSLTNVDFGANIKIIGKQAFEDCKKLSGIIVTAAEMIGYRAFANTPKAKRVRLLGAKSIGEEAFREANVEHLILNDGLESIKSGAFMGNKKLKEVVIPASVKVIEKFAFAECSKLETVIVTSKHTVIDGDAFPLKTEIKIKMGDK